MLNLAPLGAKSAPLQRQGLIVECILDNRTVSMLDLRVIIICDHVR